MMMGRYMDAETHVGLLMKETPDDPELLELDGQILHSKLKNDEACEQLRRAIKIKPDQINSYLLLENILVKELNRKGEADAVMLKMVQHKDNAKSLKAFQEYARYLLTEEKFDEALVQTKRVFELAPEDPLGLWIAGYCYLAKGQFKTAEEYLNRAIKADKGSPTAYRTMADVKNRLGRHDESVAILRQGLEAMREQEKAAKTQMERIKGTVGRAEIL